MVFSSISIYGLNFGQRLATYLKDFQADFNPAAPTWG